MAVYHSHGIEVREPPRNLWRDAALGMAAGVLGTVAMNGFWKRLSAVLPEDSDEEEQADQQRREASEEAERGGPLDDVALLGPYHRDEESAPETLARVAYTRIEGREPSDETRKTLASEIHWATGIGLGAIYGLLRGRARDGLDLGGGLAFGAGAWFMNDEVLVPVLGLSEGPTAHDPKEHAQALGAHLVFGLTTAAATQVLERVL